MVRGLNLYAPIPQNGQTHSNNSSAIHHFVKSVPKGLNCPLSKLDITKFPVFEYSLVELLWSQVLTQMKGGLTLKRTDLCCRGNSNSLTAVMEMPHQNRAVELLILNSQVCWQSSSSLFDLQHCRNSLHRCLLVIAMSCCTGTFFLSDWSSN